MKHSLVPFEKLRCSGKKEARPEGSIMKKNRKNFLQLLQFQSILDIHTVRNNSYLQIFWEENDVNICSTQITLASHSQVPNLHCFESAAAAGTVRAAGGGAQTNYFQWRKAGGELFRVAVTEKKRRKRRKRRRKVGFTRWITLVCCISSITDTLF